MVFQPNILMIPVITTLLFCASKIAEMKFIDKDFKPVKILFRDMLIVFVSSLSATYIYFHFSEYIQEFMNIITDSKVIVGGAGKNIASATEIFTDTPNF